jgi:hypothetical protein
VAAVSALSAIMVTALLPLFFLCKFVAQKPPVSKTLIDLIYRDCIVYNYFLSLRNQNFFDV